MQSRLVEEIAAALERKREGRLADATDRIDHVFRDRSNLWSSTPTPRIGHAEDGLVEAVIAALEQERQGHLAGGTERREHVFHDRMMRGHIQPSTFARIERSEGGSVEAVIPTLEWKQDGHSADGTLCIKHVFNDKVMGGNLQSSAATARSGRTEYNLAEAVIPALEREQEEALADATDRIEHIVHDQLTRGNLQSSSLTARIGHAESGLVEAAITALEREQEKTLADATDRTEHIVHDQMMRGNLQSTPTATIGHAGPSRRTQDSLIKARYASTVLRVAQTTDQKTAARLVRGLAHDFPHPNELQKIADIHLSAIEAFFQLAAELEDAIDFKQRNLWSNALAAAHDWLRAVSP